VKTLQIMLALIMATPVAADVGVYQIEQTNALGLAWRINTQTGQVSFCSLTDESACFPESKVGDAGETGTYQIVPMVDFPARAWRINTATGSISWCSALEGIVTCSSVVDR